MSLALWLLLVAVLDLIRAGRDLSAARIVSALAGLGLALCLLLAFLVQPAGIGWIAWVIAAVAVAGWVLGSAAAAAEFRGSVVRGVPGWVTARLAATVGYASLGIGVISLLLAGSAGGTAPGLLSSLSESGLGRFSGEWVLLVVALFLLQISTANVIVRLLLDLIGVPASDNEKKLRGGRVLGPMERLVILGLGIGGSLLGAAVVVAAKALLRFPELRVPKAGDPGYGGASDVTEYFLVGSFASWLVALGAIGLAALAGG